jgi:hypothetical protein
MKKNISTFTFLGLTLMIVLLNACASVAPASSTPNKSNPFPTGNFKAVSPLYAEEIRFFDNGIYGVVFRGESSIGYSGNYTITGDQLVFDDPDTDCAGHSGTYNWSFDGTTLTLKVIEDTCTALPRAEDLGHAWVKLP